MKHSTEQKPEALQLAEKLRDAIGLIECGFSDDIATNDLSLAAMELESLHTRVQELEGHIAQNRKMAAPVVLPEPVMAQVRYIASQSTQWSNCTVENADAMVGGAYEVRYLYTEQQVRELLANTKRSTNRDDESVGLREALVRAHDWMDSQADSQSKGGHATFDLMMLREERNAIKSALDEAPQPQADALDAECFRFWVSEAARSPAAMAKLIMHCTTEDEYRAAITQCIYARKAAIAAAKWKP